MTTFCLALLAAGAYFPLPDSAGGWRTRPPATKVRTQLDSAFEYIQGSTRHGGLLVVHKGWLIYERYFGYGCRQATPNLASVGKCFTSIALGILMGERPDLFPRGLDTLVYTPKYLPPEAFPLTDPRKAGIRLGQLLSMTAGIRGNNPGIVQGREVTLDPAGPDGASAMRDSLAFGKTSAALNAITLWCEPGAGYSYATSSIHIVSAIVRHLTGMEMEDYLRPRLAAPLGWSRWGFGYKSRNLEHTPGGGGICLRGTDQLRFLYLLLQGGRWNGRQIVPWDYVRQCGRTSHYNPHAPYSLQFDVNTGGQLDGVPRDAFWKSGSGGHGVYVVPSLDLVAVKLGGRDGQYLEPDTGLPEPPTVKDLLRDPNWKATHPHPDAIRKTLALIVQALQ
jgi:CubicO group peptidase (beta-lactamase class C family)